MTPNSSGRFCPDCGKMVELSWYLLRCGCCYSKRQAILAYDTILPEEKFCSKCGEKEYFIEKKEKLAFFDLDYVILIREESGENKIYGHKTQIWIDDEENRNKFIQPKLIPVFVK